MDTSIIRKDGKLNLNISESVALFSYFMVILSRIMLFSSISEYMLPLARILKYVSIFFIMLIVVIYLVSQPKGWRQILCIIGGFTLAVVEIFTNGLQNNISMAILLGLSLFGINCTLRKLASVQGLGMLVGSAIIIFLSFYGPLPQNGFASKVYSFQSSYQETVYFYGFNHPNAFGTIITMGIILFCLGKNISRKVFGIILMVCVLMDFKAGADTAMMAALLIFLGVILTPFREVLYRLGYYITSSFLVILPVLSVWLGINSATSIGQWVGKVISSRPLIWNYYLSLEPIKLIADPPQLDFSIGNNVVGNGVLDGSYIYALVYWGGLPLILIVIAWKIWIPYVKKPTEFQWMILLFIFAVTVMGFPESHMLSYYENIFILGIGLLQFNSSKRKLLLNSWSFEEEYNENID